MSKRNTPPTYILPVFALAALCVFAAVFTAQINAPTNQTESGSAAALEKISLAFTPQKGPQEAAGSVKPIRGVDVIVQKDPGNTAVRTATTDGDGKVKFVGLPPGKYSLVLRKGSKTTEAKVGGASADAADAGDYLVTIVGARGGPIEGAWSAKLGMFAKGVAKAAQSSRIRQNLAIDHGNLRESAPVYEDKLLFEIGPPTSPPTPVSITIIKSKSNITNN